MVHIHVEMAKERWMKHDPGNVCLSPDTKGGRRLEGIAHYMEIITREDYDGSKERLAYMM
jgi:hypothetical protein